MPEEESTVNPPEPPVVPPAAPGGEPGPGSVPFGTPFAPEPGTETPFTGGGAEDEGRISNPPPGTGPVARLDQPSDDDRLMAALAWISMVVIQVPVVSIVLLLSEGNKGRPFQRYHATTSILFWLGAVVYEVLAIFAYVVLGLVTLGCGFLCLWPILLVPHTLALWYGIQAYQGNYSEVPAASQFARSQRWV